MWISSAILPGNSAWREHFWNDSGELYDFLIEPTGLTFQEFKEKKRIFAPLVYRQFEKNGFNTPSGKVELYSSLLEKNDCAPLPAYTEPCRKPRRRPETGGGVSLHPDHGMAAAGLPAHGKPGKSASQGNCPPAGPPDPSGYRNAGWESRKGTPSSSRPRRAARHCLPFSPWGSTPTSFRPRRAGGARPTSTGSFPGINSPKGSAPCPCGGSSAVSEKVPPDSGSVEMR